MFLKLSMAAYCAMIREVVWMLLFSSFCFHYLARNCNIVILNLWNQFWQVRSFSKPIFDKYLPGQIPAKRKKIKCWNCAKKYKLRDRESTKTTFTFRKTELKHKFHVCENRVRIETEAHKFTLTERWLPRWHREGTGPVETLIYVHPDLGFFMMLPLHDERPLIRKPVYSVEVLGKITSRGSWS